jgi:hypothetical protein
MYEYVDVILVAIHIRFHIWVSTILSVVGYRKLTEYLQEDFMFIYGILDKVIHHNIYIVSHIQFFFF